ncbi:FtsX-like permease family protein [Paenibacillus radicis (ex Gao et al. 2016)]|uniref:ABC transporter permease n=1 Tax=Paenibacillus radicis (ex Gao et al. 2016) TaxID=1737354 RepID=A0A917H215_9BACL|nr:ABC transporter permease [Paenibacillus radicis (ex Gao et al. 2016)]GGG64371.1 ABC transporter permease [Paenibacillus radicis (ex Gao et al. 2016)]
MLMKLALSGMKSKLKDYLVLLAGLVISISIFYMFQTMAWNRSFTENNAVINSIQLVYVLGTILLSAITFFYILYANGFLLSLRQREFGLYMVLGARKDKIRKLMFIETIVLGMVSLAAGLGIGFGLSALVGRLMAQQLQADLTGYYPVYGPAIGFTVLFFVALFIFSALWNQLKLARMQVLQLLHGSMRADRPWRSSGWKKVMVVVGVIAILLGYLSLTFMEQLREIGLFTATIMTPLGTYLLFMAFLPPLVARLKKSHQLRGIRAFTFGQLSFRINELTKLLATVAMLIALGAGAIAGGLAFWNDAFIRGETYRVYDATVHDPNEAETNVLAGIPFKERFTYRYKLDNEILYYAKEDLESQRPLVHSQQGRDYWDQLKRVEDPLPKATADSAGKAVAGESANSSAGGVAGESADGTAASADTGIESGVEGETAGGIENGESLSSDWTTFLWQIAPTNLSYSDVRLADNVQFDALEAKEQIVVIGRTDDFLAYRSSWEKLDQLAMEKSEGMGVTWSKYENYQRALGISSGTMFMGFFLGIAFLAMMASCLMFKILSGAAKDIQRYEMLHKLGVRRERLSRSIYTELLLVFLFPGIAGLLHVLVGMRLFSFILAEPYYRLWLPILLFAVIYSAYYFITVNLYKRIVLR